MTLWRRHSGLLAALLVWIGFTPSALNASDSVVVFNEVHYHSAYDKDSELEWIELHNQMAVDVDLSAWRIDGGIQFDFALDTVIPGGGYVVVARNPQALQAATGFPGALGPFTGSLANGGEELVLYNHNRLQPNAELEGRRVMDRLAYTDNAPWPVASDGSGVTLAKRDPDTGSKQPENWTWSSQMGGTPGAENFPAADSVPLDIIRVLEVDANWRYNQAGENFDASWAGAPHPDGGNWSTGPGAFGFEAKLNDIIGTPLTQPTLNQPYVATHYFETDIELTAEVIHRIAHINIAHLVDDGAVFYINGEEAHRYNMPAGAISFESLATSSTEAEWIAVEQLSAASLVPGTNRVSVEVHQSSIGSSDVAFGLTLDIALAPPSVGGTDFSGLKLNELSAADGATPLVIELFNSRSQPLQLDGIVISISGDPDREWIIPDGTTLAAESWFVLDGPALIATDQDRVILLSPGRDQVIDARQASASLRGLVAEGEFAGRWLHPDKPTFGGANSFVLANAIVINEIFYHAYPERGFPDIPPALGDAVLLPLASPWRYHENVSGEGLPAGWATTTHTDWPVGMALLGREPTALEEPIRTALSFSRPQVTYYFETEFPFTGDVNSGLTLRHFIDDGAIFYLNGVEISRINMPAGPVTPDTLANPSVDNAESITTTNAGANLVQGNNRLSAEVHQANVGSSDIIFGVEILGKSVIAPGIPGQPYREPGDEWIELFNRSSQPVDISGWSLQSGVDFTFPGGTTIAPSAYLLIADDEATLQAKHPAISIAGSFNGGLANGGERLVLADAAGNPADEVDYADAGRWPIYPDGGGSSLELKDAAADNRAPEAWAASDESTRSAWQTYSYRGIAENDRMGNNVFHEFLLGLLDAGELLLDDVSVIEDPSGAATEFVQNGSFESDAVGELAEKWRAVGTHGSHGRTIVVSDPDNPANKCLHVVATGPTGDKHNKIETTFANRERVVVGTEYQISFRAKWLAGSNQVNTRLYFNYLQKTSLITAPDQWKQSGTPGTPNSTRVANIGPTYSQLRHEPAVPAENEPVKVSILAQDPDGVTAMSLFYSVEGADFTALAMARSTGETYIATI
ncbi:MAG: lamin tail domain-containing protein, partial [Verrucomicrobia bacterium]|nr:lamin tail domain-containing protein [Verrucomicrobiota bacterium]